VRIINQYIAILFGLYLHPLTLAIAPT